MKKSRCVLCEGIVKRYAFIKAHSKEHKLYLMCEILEISSRGYYDWRSRLESKRTRENRRLIDKILKFHQASRETYGSPRIHKDLIEGGEICSVNRVARLMKVEDLRSKMARKFVITTDSKNTLAPAPDLLKRGFKVKRANERWVSDTTFIATRQGWLYLAIVLELYSRKIIGWSMGKKNNAQLVSDALMMALWRRGGIGGSTHQQT